MRKHIKKVISHPLISGSTIIFIGSFGGNILNYLFNLSAGRLLSINDYRILISLTALITLLMLFQSAWTNVFTKLAAKYAHQGISSQGYLIRSGVKLTFSVGAVYLAVLILLIQPISLYLHIDNTLVVLTMLCSVFFAIAGSLPSGILQGNLKFIWASLSNIAGALGKLIIGVILIIFGWGLFGAALAVLFAFIIPYIFSMTYVLKKYNLENSKDKTHVDFFAEFKKISGAFFIASIAITVLQGTDVIFASHYLSDIEAGQYAALSLMGKAIFYITSPIYFVFFPLIAHKKEKNENTSGTILLASTIIFLCSGFLTFIYFAFPSLVLKIFFPDPVYQPLTAYLGFYSIYIMIFSFCFLLYNFFLSAGKIGVYKINLAIAILYIFSLFVYHRTIWDFIIVLTFSSFLLLILLLVYYKHYEH
ncbi:MAG TPA: oligosaccharide flippase family protein [Candidatus Levybacteria bacterium]|nr:oligosaccharide flippase family protein [Candidatus Levybacteria bacterium]